MKKVKCYDCHLPLEEHNEFECYDEEGSDAYWDDTRKVWICNSCRNI